MKSRVHPKYGGKGRRGWKKLHLWATAAGEIVAQLLADGDVHDAPTGIEMIDSLACLIQSVIEDAA